MHKSEIEHMIDFLTVLHSAELYYIRVNRLKR